MKKQLSQEDALGVLRLLNEAESAQQLAEQVELPQERDVGVKLATRILEKRAALGGAFSTIEEVYAISQLGPERLSEVVEAARRRGLAVEPERGQFHRLILQNPNYFGSFPDLGLEPVKLIQANTSYEKLLCLGLNPQANRLEAVVAINRNYGYGGTACAGGSTEYVRFFVRRGATWADLGVAEFTTYDMPGSALPLSYTVSVEMDEARLFCSAENVVEVRAILSWNLEPPAGNAGWTPPWGNAVDARVQIAPRRLFTIPIGELIKEKQIQLSDELLPKLSQQQTLQFDEPQALGYGQLKAAYAKSAVPSHRFGFPEATRLLKQRLTGIARRLPPQPAPAIASDVHHRHLGHEAPQPQPELALPALIPALEISPDLAEILKNIDLTIGDTTYEQLSCVGYNPETRELGGVITIKRNSGYSGSLCTPGSTEYVGFWLFYDGAWHPLGTAQVTVHDLASVSAGNTVEYAVQRIANVPERACAGLAGLRLRAILSWEVPPTGPDFEPTWGNVVNTYVQPIVGDPSGDGHRVRLMRFGGVTISGISDTTGLANPTGVAGDCNDPTRNNDSPFGGAIIIEGDLTNKLDVFHPVTGQLLPGAQPLRYQVFTKKVGAPGAATQLTNSFQIAVYPAAAFLPVVMTQSVQAFGGADYYTYMESNGQAVNPRTLAVWQAGGLEEGLYEVEVRAFAWNGASLVQVDSQSKRIYIYNGFPHTELVLGGGTMTAYRPQLQLGINPPYDECGDVEVGNLITGTYSVTDRFFGQLSLAVVPITVGGVPQPVNPVAIADGAVPQPNPVYFELTPQADTNGMSGTWSLNTTGMTPCGYTLVLAAWDRALVNSGCSGHYNQTAVGFCLRAADEG